MSRYRHSGTIFQLIWGLLIVGAGVVLLLDNFDILDARAIFHYWPVLLIALGLYQISAPRRHMVSGLIYATIGGLLLLDRLDIIRVHIWDFWPLIFVFIGLNMLMGYSRRQRRNDGWQTGSPEPPPGGATPGYTYGEPAAGAPVPDPAGSPFTDSIVNASAILSGANRIVTSQDFRGGHVTAVMGGSEIDLRRASINSANGPAVLDIFVLWGGVKIQVPTDWTVDVQGTPMLGGLGNQTLPPSTDSGKRLVITGEVIMGGAEVTN